MDKLTREDVEEKANELLNWCCWMNNVNEDVLNDLQSLWYNIKDEDCCLSEEFKQVLYKEIIIQADNLINNYEIKIEEVTEEIKSKRYSIVKKEKERGDN